MNKFQPLKVILSSSLTLLLVAAFFGLMGIAVELFYLLVYNDRFNWNPVIWLVVSIVLGFFVLWWLHTLYEKEDKPKNPKSNRMSYSKTIYKKDSTGKIRFLTVETEGATVHQIAGLLDTENPVKNSYVCTGKNIGKSNETTPEQQAESEAASKIAIKLTEDYFETVELAKSSEVILPMLAKEFKKESAKIDWNLPVFVQPKLDGMRCLATKDAGLVSRQGNEINTVKHIQMEIDNNPVVNTFDGELYSHGRSFQENMRLVKKYRPGETEAIRYRVYDMVLPNLPFASRYSLLKELVKNMVYVEIVPTYQVTSTEQIMEYHKKFLAEGYEGTIIRHGNAGYAINKRDTQLLKYKDFLDIQCEVIDVEPSEKNPTQGVVICKNDKGTFGCGMKFSHKEREEILQNKQDYIGQMAEVRFFEYTEDGLPRFPVCFGFCLDR